MMWLPAFRRVTLISLMLLTNAIGAGAALGEGKKKKAPAMTEKEAQMAAWKAIASSAGAIDGCTKQYLSEYPASQGKVDIAVTLAENGAVSKARATTGLEGARHLRPCLERVGKGWKFPPVSKANQTLNITVPVLKGAKFSLLKPGEKPKPKEKKSKKKAEGFIRFLPGAWGKGIEDG